MSTETAIAIVGRGCVLPGALDPATLWTRIQRRDDLLGPSTVAHWGLHPESVCADLEAPSACARGGYVNGFDPAWRPARLAERVQRGTTVPTGWNWLAFAALQALHEAGAGGDLGARGGLIVGNLGYPTRALADIAARRWAGDVGADGPAMAGQSGALQWTVDACGLAGPRMSLDAACASGLYALKIACDVLRSRRADVMLAGGLNASDDLFLHIGFTALGALSPTGRSSPLSRLADGLVPAEGAAVVALKRLDDAVTAGDRIFAIVRGVGLSNDGREAGLLAPATAGQQRAMRAAWASAGVSPASLEYLECHATGTLVGDRVEMASIRAVFGGGHGLRLGSLKAQLGHLITASAGAALLKICGAFEHATIPPAPVVSLDHPIDELRSSAFELPDTALPWRPGAHPRRAAINAFGFGGCNAHVVLDGPEAVDVLAQATHPRRGNRPQPANGPLDRGDVPAGTGHDVQRAVALVACEIAVGSASDSTAVLRVLLGLDEPTRRIGDIELAVSGLGFPPADLEQALPQQLLLLRAAQILRPQLAGIDAERLGVFIGADVDPAGARHGLRWRLEQVLDRPCRDAERNVAVPPLKAAGVVGTMPNMPANRLSSLLDARGPGFVVTDGAASGRRAFELAAAALACGELDAALVGAVDCSGGAFGDDPSRADACVLLLLMPAARAADRDVLATCCALADQPATPGPSLPWAHTGAASDLLELAVAALCCRHALLPSDPAQPWIASERIVRIHGCEVRASSVQGLAIEAPRLPAGERPRQQGDGDSAVGWVFTGAAAAYPGAGSSLLRAFPDLCDALREMAPRLSASLPALLGRPALSLNEQLLVATVVSQAHAQLLRRVGVTPVACLGLSSGETNALLATGTWTDADDLFADVSSSLMYEAHLAGRYEVLRRAWRLGADESPSWRCYRLTYSVDRLRAAIARTSRVSLLVVHHGNDAVIGGDDRACRALIESLGAPAVPLGHDLVVHCRELEPFADAWYRVHHRATNAITTPRLYANAVHGAYVPSADRCAEMLTTQARSTVEFDRTIRQAWDDGVRCFVELGPRAACTGWIDEILAGRPHLACAMDGARGSLADLAGALTTLRDGGVPVDVDAWNARMAALRVIALPGARAGAIVRLPGHLPQPSFQAPAPVRLLPPAPPLAPLLPERLRSVVSPAVALPATDVAPATPLPSPALAALGNVQHALLQAQQIAVAHLEAASPMWLPAEAGSYESMSGSYELPAKAGSYEGMSGSDIPDRWLPASAGSPVPPHPRRTFTREQLEIHARGRISDVFGPTFAVQDDYVRQVRMPTPPLLLADRVVDLDAPPGTMGLGRVVTETDVRADAWYLHHGRMPAGIVIEAGQADLLLISWLGVDLHNRGERVYRLLGCELTFHGRLPAIGERLQYDIAIEGHARHGDVGLFFFRSDCRTSDGDARLTVRRGQAGFFTDAELANSAGVLWTPEDDAPGSGPVAGPRPGVEPASSYDAAQVAAFANGDAFGTFGPAFVRCASHTRSPRIPAGRLQLFERVEVLDVTGGPWRRGYLRAVLPIAPDSWFFDGHFLNDPCMPGTLMLEGCLQAMAFYLAALGHAIERDGWSFEPVTEQPYLLRCRGQVTPRSRELTYEVFVAELHDGPEPMLVADVMGSVDGLRAFHCRRMAVRLMPDFPLGPSELSRMAPDREPVVEIDGFRYGQASLLACATGDPRAAFGALYAAMRPSMRVPRLPGPPYHFISRVTSITDPPGQLRPGVVVETAYDLPPDAWYFTAHSARRMPACVLIEAPLQTCGWLAAYVGCDAVDPQELYFRNLDGTGVLHRSIRPDDGCLRVRSTLTSISRVGGMTLVNFDVACRVGDEVIYQLTTTFGFFPKAALAGQTGLAAGEEERRLAETRGERNLLDTLSPRSRAYLAQPPLCMCDRVTERRIAADGSAVLRGERAVTPEAWYFKAHFFQDPVQPGSLGVEALVQLLQAHLLLEGAADALPDPAFADLVGPEPTIWQLRGQVLPEASLVTITLEAEPIVKTPARWTVRAQGSLWVDGVRIYQVRGMTVTMAAGHDPDAWATRAGVQDTTEAWWNARDWRSGEPALRPLFLAACRRFVRTVRLLDPDAIAALHGAPMLLLANHQVAIESALAGMVLPPFLGRPLTILAKQEHLDTWVGRLAVGLNDDRFGPSTVFVDRERQQEMLERLAELGALARSGARSLMVHVEGTRARQGGQPVTTVSAIWADLAARAGAAIVPVRFCGGLPRAGVDERLDCPSGFGALDIVIGRPIPGQPLAELALNARRDRILAGLAELAPFDREPVPDPVFTARVARARARWSLDELRAVFLLLQADAHGWPLDESGVPADVDAARDRDDPFWAWFGGHATSPR